MRSRDVRSGFCLQYWIALVRSLLTQRRLVTAVNLQRDVWMKNLNELTNTYIENSPSTRERLYWINALSLVSTMAHYCIMIKYGLLSGILQMREPNQRSSIAPFLGPTSPRLSTLHESSGSLIATW